MSENHTAHQVIPDMPFAHGTITNDAETWRFVSPFPNTPRNTPALPSPSVSAGVLQTPSCAEIVSQSADATKAEAGQWTTQEREMLLDWLGSNLTDIADLKTDFRSTCDRISAEVFKGVRTADGIEGQWEGMMRKYQRARQRLQSAGGGQRNGGGKRESIELGWLDRLCPFYEQVDDIMRRDKSVAPLYVSEVGGEELVEFVEGVRQRELSVVSEADWVPDSDEDYGVHPPAGGSKLPQATKRERRKGESKGTGARALKKRKVSAMEDKLHLIHERRLAFEEKRFMYEKERDEKYFSLMKQKEENRHESLIRLRVMEKKIALLLARLDNDSSSK